MAIPSVRILLEYMEARFAANLHSREVSSGIINTTRLTALPSFNSFLRKQVSERAAQAASIL